MLYVRLPDLFQSEFLNEDRNMAEASAHLGRELGEFRVDDPIQARGSDTIALISQGLPSRERKRPDAFPKRLRTHDAQPLPPAPLY